VSGETGSLQRGCGSWLGTSAQWGTGGERFRPSRRWSPRPAQGFQVIRERSSTLSRFAAPDASALIAAGWEIEEVSARLGHTGVATTQRIYVHAFDAARRSDDRRERLAALLGRTSTAL
jgi:integrase